MTRPGSLRWWVAGLLDRPVLHDRPGRRLAHPPPPPPGGPVNPVHDPAACYAADCHHHTGPLEPRDAPPPANPETTPQMHHGGHVTGPGEFIPYRLDGDHVMTAAEVQATGVLDHVTLYRYPDAEPPCEHGATLTFRTGVIGGHHVTFDTPLTYCFDCHALAPTPQEDTQP